VPRTAFVSLAILVLCVSTVRAQWVQPTPPNGPIYYNGGNVGIGSTAPVDALHVEGPANTNIRIVHTATTADKSMLGFFEGVNLFGFLNQRGSAFAGQARQFNVGNNDASGALSLWAGGAQRM